MRVIGLFSGGIDSPVACALVGRRCEVVPLYLCTYPYAPMESVHATLTSLRRFKSACGFRLAIVAAWREVMERIVRGLRWREYTCIVCKHAMLRAADVACDRVGASAIVTGDSLGQKASQTLENLASVSHGIRHPILRPLLGFDKAEIEATSRRLGLSYERHAGGCTAVPPRPRTRSRPEDVVRMFSELGLEEEVKRAMDASVEVRDLDSIPRLLEKLE